MSDTFVCRWVHLVCALYVPGVAFSDVDKLCGVTLFEMSYAKWGAKVHVCLFSLLMYTVYRYGIPTG